MASLSQHIAALESASSTNRVVKVTVPPNVLNNLRTFQKVQASILDRLGCPACCSGFDIRYDMTRTFAVDAKLRVNELPFG